MTSVEECQAAAAARSEYALEYVVALALAGQRLLAAVLVPETWRVPLVQFRGSRVRSLHHACNKQPPHQSEPLHNTRHYNFCIFQLLFRFQELRNKPELQD